MLFGEILIIVVNGGDVDVTFCNDHFIVPGCYRMVNFSF